jgi:hypothetical protein
LKKGETTKNDVPEIEKDKKKKSLENSFRHVFFWVVEQKFESEMRWKKNKNKASLTTKKKELASLSFSFLGFDDFDEGGNKKKKLNLYFVSLPRLACVMDRWWEKKKKNHTRHTRELRVVVLMYQKERDAYVITIRRRVEFL